MSRVRVDSRSMAWTRDQFDVFSFAYVEASIPAGMTVTAYRRSRRPSAARRRWWLWGLR